jgi:hypothetical protein
MLPESVQGALNTLTDLFATRPALVDAVRSRWRAGSRADVYEGLDSVVPEDVASASDAFAAAMPALTRSDADVALLGELFATPSGETLLAWCGASTWRRAPERTAARHGRHATGDA